MHRRKVLITGPSRLDLGGVANYYNAVLPYLVDSESYDVQYLEIGRKGRSMNIAHIFADQLRVAKEISGFSPDIVHLNPSLNYKSLFRDALFAISAKRSHAHLLVFFRGWDEMLAARVGRSLRGFFSSTLGRADAFIVLADDMRERLQDWGVAVPVFKETTVVSDSTVKGFDVEEKVTALCSDHEVRVLFMARLEANKGIFETIDAVLELARSGLPISLTIAGDGNAMEAVEQRLELEPIANKHVRIAGYVRDEAKTELLKSHHIYCLPSYHGEGMPNSLIEAMAFGLPVITCKIGGIADMFADGKMGYLVPPKDTSAIALRLRAMVSSKEVLGKMGTHCHRYAMSNLLASQAADRLGRIYDSL